MDLEQAGLAEANPALPAKVTGPWDGVFSLFEVRILGVPLWAVGLGALGYVLFRKSRVGSSLFGWDEYDDIDPEPEFED